MLDVLMARSGCDGDEVLARLNCATGLRCRVTCEDLAEVVARDSEVQWQGAGAVAFCASDELGRLVPRHVEALSRFHEVYPTTMLLAGVGSRPDGRWSVADRIALLDAGADDVVRLDIDVAEYAARVRAVLRRRNRYFSLPAASPSEGRPWVDPQLRHLVGSRGVQLLTAKECLVIVAILAADPVATRTSIGRQLWTDGWYGTPKAIDMHVANLRRKLRLVSGDEWRIETIRGSGFLLTAASMSTAVSA